MVEIKDFNEEKHQYSISVVSSKEWTKFMLDVLTARLETVKGVKLGGTKITIRDNVAKVMISWTSNNNAYHEFTFHVDEFGRKSKNYQDLVSNIWQNLMSEKYGIEYNKALQSKLEEINTKTI